ncbi:hypothetical protein ACTMUQ_20365 [Streptomyces sp. SD11]|uniref:hypothetical protein n=1 Tax=Streptomyces sp. SD11 TaxID=3452209 RepID=UPI003F8C19C6
MTGKAGEEGHIRPEHGTDVMDHGTENLADPAGGAPVFVDPSGRRASRMRRMGWLVAAGCVCSAATLGVAVAGGNSTAPWLQIPGMLGGAGQNRSVEEVRKPVQQGPVSPSADNPSPADVGSPLREGAGTTAAGTTDGRASDKKDTDSLTDEASAAGPSAGASGAGSVPAGDTETVAGQPGEASPTGTAQAPTAAPSAADPTPPASSTEPSPTGTPSTGLLDGLADAVSDLFGG